jgi:hypothetical protein
MQHVEGSGTPVLYIYDARFLKVKSWKHLINFKIGPYILN